MCTNTNYAYIVERVLERLERGFERGMSRL